MTRIGFVGIGRLGLPVCSNLVAAGFDLMAADSDPGRHEEARRHGIRCGARPDEVARTADILITMLPGPAEERDALVGSGAALAALPETAVWIDMTTNSPDIGKTLRAAAARQQDIASVVAWLLALRGYRGSPSQRRRLDTETRVP